MKKLNKKLYQDNYYGWTFRTKWWWIKQIRASKEKNKVVEFIKGGGVTGAIVRGVSGAIQKGKAKAKDRKINDSLLGTSDYQGDVSGKPKSTAPVGGGSDNDDPKDLRTGKTIKSIEQPKVKSQMNNSEVKSDLTSVLLI